MKHGRKLLAPLLALILLLALALPAAADYPARTEELDLSKDWTGKTILLHTNDVHGAISGYAVAANMKQKLESAGAEVLLIDAGDFLQGDAAVSMSEGASAVELMNAAGYDLAIPGNHEFDYGVSQLLEDAGGAQFPIICANVFRGEEPLFPADWTYTGKSGMKIGFFGLDTPESQTKAAPKLTVGLTFLADEALYACAQEEVQTLRGGGADLVIALTHLGVEAGSAPNRSQDVYANVTGIDFVIDGHSHTVMTAGENGEPIQSTGTKSANIGVIVIDNETKAIEDHHLVSTQGLEQAPDVSAKVAAINASVNEAFGEVIGRSEVTLEGDRAFNRTQETNHGDFATKAMRDFILAQPDALRVDADHLIAIMNGGGIRAAIEPGDVTRRDVNEVFPFSNTLCVVYATGAQLLEALEASTAHVPGQEGGFPQTAGIVWTIDTTKPYDQGEQYPASTFYAPASIRRVSVQSVNGQPFSSTDTYAIACNDFTAMGGDTYYVFKALDRFDTGALIDVMLMDYISDALGGVIGQEFAAPRGDITILTPENSRCAPSTQRFVLDGAEVKPEAYNINGENYVKLRDLAMLLSGTPAQFAVDYDAKANAVALTTGKTYTPVGGELAAGQDRSAALAVSAQSLTVDGEAKSLCAYNLAGYNFFRLQDLSALLGFDAAYDGESQTLHITTSAAKAA